MCEMAAILSRPQCVNYCYFCCRHCSWCIYSSATTSATITAYTFATTFAATTVLLLLILLTPLQLLLSNMMTFSNGNILRITGPLCGNSPVTGKLPSQRPATRGFDVFFDLHLNKGLSKQSRSRWFETQSRSLWRHCNDYHHLHHV